MQAPIGPAATPELVIAVAGAGALGTLAASWTEPAELRKQIRGIQSVLELQFCVNLVLAFDQGERLNERCAGRLDYRLSPRAASPTRSP
jgi:NAD(P)H-dependent flavin oxidoreductase YrpB (nitropropane dioxygenase family)